MRKAENKLLDISLQLSKINKLKNHQKKHLKKGHSYFLPKCTEVVVKLLRYASNVVNAKKRKQLPQNPHALASVPGVKLTVSTLTNIEEHVD